MGFQHSVESLAKISYCSSHLSEETRLKRSIASAGINNPNYGKVISKEQKEILRKAQTGRKHSKETIEKRVSKFRKKVIDTSTQIIYSSITDAAKSINLSPAQLGRKLNGECKNNTTLVYLKNNKNI